MQLKRFKPSQWLLASPRLDAILSAVQRHWPVSVEAAQKKISREVPSLVETRHPLNIPEQVWVEILSYLELDDLFVCGRICHMFAHLLRHDLYLQYRTELALNGMVDVGGRDCVRDRLKILQRRRAIQDEGHMREPLVHRGNMNAGFTFGCDASCCVGDQSRGTASILAPSQTAGPGLTKLRVYTITPCATPISERLCSFQTVDHHQDLLVVAHCVSDSWDVVISALSLSRSCSLHSVLHPQAAQPILTVTFADPYNHYIPLKQTQILDTQVCGPYVGFKLKASYRDFHTLDWPGQSELLVWNWRTGCVVWRRLLPDSFPWYTFLDDMHLVVLTRVSVEDREESLLVFRFAEGSHSRPCSDLESAHAVGHIMTFALPSRNLVRGIWRLEESPAYLHATPFRHDLSLDILTLKCDRAFPSPKRGDRATYLLLVPRSTLYAHLQAAYDSPLLDQLPRYVPWLSWGPSGSLVLDLATPQMTVHFVYVYPHASKAVIVVPHKEQSATKGPQATTRMQTLVYDLNPWVGRRARQERPDKLDRAVRVRGTKAQKRAFGILDKTTGPGAPYACSRGPVVDIPGDISSIFALTTAAFDGGFTIHSQSVQHSHTLSQTFLYRAT